MHAMIRTTLAACLLLAAAARAQDLVPAAPPQTKPVWILNATIHTMAGRTIESGTLRFENGVITHVAEGQIPMDRRAADVIDARGLHVYPGLIHADAQIGLIEIAAVDVTRDMDELGDFSPEVRAITALNPDTTLIPVTRSNGVLLAMTSPDGGRMPGQPAVIRMDGWTNEDLAVVASAGQIVNWPFPRPVERWWMDEDEEEQEERIAEDVAAIDRLWRRAEAYRGQRAAERESPADLRLEAMLACLPPEEGSGTEQRPVFLRASEMQQIAEAVAWAVGRGLRPIVVGGQSADLVAELLIEHDVPVIVGGTHRFPRRSDSAYDEAFALPARLEAAGVRWCLAGAERDGNERNLAYEAAMAAAHGLDPEAALEAVTVRAAEILGIADRYGSLEDGKSATLIVTDGNPLEITTNVLHAFIDGRRVVLDDKQKALERKYREKYEQLGDLEEES